MVSYNRVTASGLTDVLNVPTPYLEKAHIKVSKDGVLSDPSSYTWLTDAQVKFNAGNPPAGTVLEARRKTPTEAMVTFEPGNLDPADLNLANRQALFVAEEGLDLADDLQDRSWVTAGFQTGGTITKAPAGYVATFDADGNIVGSFDAGDIAAAQGYAVAAGLSADDAADSAALAQAWAEGTLPGGPGTKSSKEWAEEAADIIDTLFLPSFTSKALAAAATIPAYVKRITTEFYAPVFGTPSTLVGGAKYRRATLAQTSGFPAATVFRSVDRFMPDGSTDNTNGGYWLLDEKRPTVHMTGALGDGTTDDVVAINAALSYMAAKGGGEVLIPATGAAYRITDTVTIGNGTALIGSRTSVFPGTTAPEAQWTQAGTWIKPTHASNSAIRLVGHGSCLRGVSFYHTQPIPTGGAYTPNAYGWAIEVNSVHSTVEDILFCCPTNGLILNYTSESGGGTGVVIRNVIGGCFGTFFKTTNVNDTAYFSNMHARPLWYTGFITTTYFQLMTGWDCGYTDNCIVDGFEMVFLRRGLYLRNQTCLDNTHSLYNGQLSGIQLSLCKVGMEVENALTNATAQINDMVVQQGNMFGFTWSDECMSLGSDFVDFQIANLKVNDAGGKVMTLGNGTGGRIQIANLDVRSYSSVAGGQTAFTMNAGCKIRLGTYRVVKPGGAGSRFGGAGMDAGLITAAYSVAACPFGRFSEQDLTAGSSGWLDFGTDAIYRPGVSGAHQIRLVGDVNVVTTGGSTMQLRYSAMGTETTTPTAPTTSGGFKTMDTGWVDITEAIITGLGNPGRLQINLTSGVRVGNGTVTLLVR